MIIDLWGEIQTLLGLTAEDLNWYQMGLRALVIYLATLLMIRIGEKRFMGKSTAFDVILGVVLGSVVSRAINGGASLFPTIAAGTVLVLLHWLFAVLSFHTDWFGVLVKGDSRQLVEEGEIRWQAMRRSHISERDLMKAVRSETNSGDLSQVKEAYLERDGSISVITRSREPKVVDVVVREGVQTVRIELGSGGD